MEIDAIAVSGSMLSNGQLFRKLSQEIAMNHRIYFNNQLPVDGRNLAYGGLLLED